MADAPPPRPTSAQSPPLPDSAQPLPRPAPPRRADHDPGLDAPDPRVQMNVRIPTSLRDTIDLRRAALHLTRDEWVRRALTYALSTPPGTPTSIRTMNGHRTTRSLL